MHKSGNSLANYLTQNVDGRKINKRGRSNKGMVDGSFFLQNKQQKRHDNSMPQSNLLLTLSRLYRRLVNASKHGQLQFCKVGSLKCLTFWFRPSFVIIPLIQAYLLEFSKHPQERSDQCCLASSYFLLHKLWLRVGVFFCTTL